MKTERRHELQTNDLATWLGEAIKTTEKYSRAIMATIVAAIVLIGLYFYQSRQSAAREAKVWNAYFRAFDVGGPKEMEEIAVKQGDTLAGRWARLSLADTQLAQGASQLFDNKATAIESLQKAADNYSQLKQTAREPGVLELATLGLARTYEAQGKLEPARSEYKLFLSKYPSSAFAELAQGRLTDLERKSTKEFYDWFALQEKKSPVLGEPGTPGHKLPFDIDSLPKEAPDFKPAINLGGEKDVDGKMPTDTKPATDKPADDKVPVAPRD